MNIFYQIQSSFISSQNDWSQIIKLPHADSLNPFLYLLLRNEKLLQEANKIIILEKESEVEATFNILKSFKFNLPVYYFPQFQNPYLKSMASSSYIQEVFYFLERYYDANVHGIFIIGNISSRLKIPSKDFFDQNRLTLSKDQIISPLELSKSLKELGYYSTSKIGLENHYSARGEIFDIYFAYRESLRILYFDELIEKMNAIEKDTFFTLKNKEFENVIIHPTPLILTNKKFKQFYADSCRKLYRQSRPGLEQRKKHLELLQNNSLFDEVNSLFSFFFSSTTCLISENRQNNLPIITRDLKLLESNWHHELDTFSQLHSNRLTESDDTYIYPHPEDLFDTSASNNYRRNLDLIYLEEGHGSFIQLHDNLRFLKGNSQETIAMSPLDNFISNVQKELIPSHIFLGFLNEQNRRKLLELIPSDILPSATEFASGVMGKGFYIEKDDFICVTEQDLFGEKTPKLSKKPKRQVDFSAEDLSTLKVGDYVVYSDFGVAKYFGIETIEVNNIVNDFLLLEFSDQDKIYVPTYKFDHVQKYADSTHSISLSSLRNQKFQKAKAKARENAKKLAFDLIRLLAERSQPKTFRFSPPDNDYREFELAFPFEETPDQAIAIQNVLDGLQAEKPMDHLICGDVGFGKTEIAMRAAFKVVEDRRQVAVLVPTTVLALQHFITFSKRFSNFPISIEFVSRFKTPQQKKEILEKVSNGQIDIIIGTHALLSDNAKFKSLGLVIVDEEHRFGVGHKEKLKLMVKGLDCLSLSATPIPRTLQMSMIGLRQISIIKTAPPKRQSIYTQLIYDDDFTIKSAIEFELERQGQIFFIHNRVNDIELIKERIMKLVPKCKIVVAHGQMPEKDLEKCMKEFYEGKFDILLATTIIESGIDIPRANTLIINRADTFGLAQLHQLRGRIGRSNLKAYAYFMIPNRNTITETAKERLKAIQEFAQLGSGFWIASRDLEIRGAGDLLGPDQSGHINEIGFETYMQLLNEAIAEIKGETIFDKDIDIVTTYSSYIPSHYISDQSERMKTYKKFSAFDNFEAIDSLVEQIEDIYGPKPIEFVAFINTLKSRLIGSRLYVKEIKLSLSSIILKFDPTKLVEHEAFRQKLLSLIVTMPNYFKLLSQNSIEYRPKGHIDSSNIVELMKSIEQHLVA
jgi:transcription-repair coupling factor (superfamily II helicase)